MSSRPIRRPGDIGRQKEEKQGRLKWFDCYWLENMSFGRLQRYGEIDAIVHATMLFSLACLHPDCAESITTKMGKKNAAYCTEKK